MLLWSNKAFKPKPELISDLPNNFAAAKIEFQKRAQQHFPLGTSEKELIRQLANQGFSPQWSYGDRHIALFEEKSFPCKLQWTISWKVNRTGRIQDIQTKYVGICP